MDGQWSAGRNKAIQSRRETHRWNEGHHSKIFGRLHQFQRHQQHNHPKAHCGIEHMIQHVRKSLAIQKHQLEEQVAVFKNMVLDAMLSGLEVCVFTKGETDKLQTHPDTLARRVLGRRCWNAVKGDDNKKSVPPRWVRAQLGLWTSESTLRYRRLRWFHSMASQQFHHDLVWAVLFGKCERESVEERVRPPHRESTAICEAIGIRPPESRLL